ncbi:hypothetical protein I7I50_01463 [Histoplasma capsulatum G186AR]|uniref:Uncharacterized protein n=1 Tax=Ajellomyces capsulatus TaxID=5037 RepID=A0A8H7YFL3_AJECA|nr:hypothetical protein I7I52_12579 [Histoplasma capsulatum]QSS73335.1 hypothetical protein I7I50_01463 [Histoplasma capsulatum G186AR]
MVEKQINIFVFSPETNDHLPTPVPFQVPPSFPFLAHPLPAPHFKKVRSAHIVSCADHGVFRSHRSVDQWSVVSWGVCKITFGCTVQYICRMLACLLVFPRLPPHIPVCSPSLFIYFTCSSQPVGRCR